MVATYFGTFRFTPSKLKHEQPAWTYGRQNCTESKKLRSFHGCENVLAEVIQFVRLTAVCLYTKFGASKRSNESEILNSVGNILHASISTCWQGIRWGSEIRISAKGKLGGRRMLTIGLALCELMASNGKRNVRSPEATIIVLLVWVNSCNS